MTQFFSLTDLGLASSTGQILQNWLSAMQVQFDNYQPAQANLEFLQAEIIASLAADLAQLCSQGATNLFQTFGTDLIGVQYQQGASSSAVLTVTTSPLTTPVATLSEALTTGGPITSLPVDTTAYTIDAGSVVVSDPTATYTQTWVTTGAVQGSVSIPVTSQTPNYAYPAGSTVSGTVVYTIDAGTQFSMSLAGAPIGFASTSLVTVDSGASVNLSVSAISPGIASNGAGNPAALISPITWVSSVTAVTNASGGVDVEDDDAYLARLAQLLQTMALRPITANDYATVSQNFTPAPGTDQQEVGRATAIDGYDPTSNTYNNEREVTVCVADANGNPLNTDTMYGIGGSSSNIITIPGLWGVAGWLESLREQNFIVNVVAPNYTQIYCAVTVICVPGYIPTAVQSAIQTNLLTYLSPPNFALPVNSITGWQNSQVVYLSVVQSVIQQTSGVQAVLPGTMAVDVNPNPTNTTNDLTLSGAFPLPISSTESIPLSAITVLTS
jgi:Baseplate J-like protein